MSYKMVYIYPTWDRGQVNERTFTDPIQRVQEMLIS